VFSVSRGARWARWFAAAAVLTAVAVVAAGWLGGGAHTKRPVAAGSPVPSIGPHAGAPASRGHKALSGRQTARRSVTRHRRLARTPRHTAALPVPAVVKRVHRRIVLPARGALKAARRRVPLPAPAAVKAARRRIPLPKRTVRPARAKTAAVAAPRAVADSGTTGSVQGTVTDSVTGLTLPGVCAYLYTAAGAYAGTGACTGGAGDFVISNVAPGQYTVAIFDPVGTHPTTWFGNVSSRTSATTFTVSAGAVTSPVAVSLPELTGITGRVRDTVTAGRVEGA
jgi:hypothetical protein